MTMTASARSIGGALRHEVDVNGRHLITTDEPTALGGTDAGPAPHELLGAALASCVSTMIVMYARARDWDLDDVYVDVAYDTDATPRRVQVDVHLPSGLTSDQVMRLRRVAANCPVRRALEAGFECTEHIELDLPPADSPVVPSEAAGGGRRSG
jgi:putative redox protein